MKIAILNYSGNVGKTTIARDIFKYFTNYEIISIESINTDGKEQTIIKGEEGEKIYTEILLNDDIILDIGSSNLESFLKSNAKEKDIINSIDKFIIPCTSEIKQQSDTIKTFKDLLLIGVKSKKINIILNQVNDNQDEKKVFENLIESCKSVNIKIEPLNIIYHHDLYEYGQTLSEMITDRDYKSELEEAKKTDKNLARELAEKYIRQRKINQLKEKYEEIFNRIMTEK